VSNAGPQRPDVHAFAELSATVASEQARRAGTGRAATTPSGVGLRGDPSASPSR
jgi:hypothetical protein